MIKHKIMTEFGIEAEIWKVGYISLDRVNKYGSITMCLYLSEEATQYLTKVTEVILSTETFDTYFENGGRCDRKFGTFYDGKLRGIYRRTKKHDKLDRRKYK